jgi:hypothetical protein
VRLIEDFLARAGTGRCTDFREVGEVVSKVRPSPFFIITQLCAYDTNQLYFTTQVGFKSFLNITPTVVHSSSSSSSSSSPTPEFTLTFEENPLAEFVELPEDALASPTEGRQGLWYSNVLCGVIRGALEMVLLSPPLVFSVFLSVF